MYSGFSNHLVTITQDTKTAFLQYLRENPNSRRVSSTDKENLILWLIDPDKRPSSQKESSRRHYIRKTFTWNEEAQVLLAIKKRDEEKYREVVTEDMIADVVGSVHENNGHAGWDATWKDVSSSYYGILRADVIFLLKRCQICAENPRKRPKNSSNAMSTKVSDESILYNDDLLDNSIFGRLVNENSSIG